MSSLDNEVDRGDACEREREEEEEEEEVERDTRESSSERYFSVRWMRERERARAASDDCSSAFAIIPVAGVCLLALYVIWLDHASQGFLQWLAGGSALARFLPAKLMDSQLVFDDWELAGGEGGSGDGTPVLEAFA